MARKGICIFGFGLHPSCALIVWLSAVLAVQRFQLCGFGRIGQHSFIGPRAFQALAGFDVLGRWLLLTLWFDLGLQRTG